VRDSKFQNDVHLFACEILIIVFISLLKKMETKFYLFIDNLMVKNSISNFS